jgi:hypothetical protein
MILPLLPLPLPDHAGAFRPWAQFARWMQWQW